jgi:hypothetical protein
LLLPRRAAAAAAAAPRCLRRRAAPARADAPRVPPQRQLQQHAAPSADAHNTPAGAAGPAAGPVFATEAALSDEQRRGMSNLLADHIISGSSWDSPSERTAHRMNHDVAP